MTTGDKWPTLFSPRSMPPGNAFPLSGKSVFCSQYFIIWSAYPCQVKLRMLLTIYVRPKESYLKLNRVRDVIELPINDVLDINGWDVDKTLKLLHKSNPTVFEWFSSPIVYQNTDFAEAFKLVMRRYFSSKSGLWHYLQMAERNYREYLRGDMVKAKKYFYVLRPILACRWILEKGTPPPMLFSELAASQLPDYLEETVAKLLDLKMNLPEVKMIPRIDILNEYLDRSIEEVRALVLQYPKETIQDWDELNKLFLTALEM